MKIQLCCRLCGIHPFHLGNMFSTLTQSQSLFAHLATTKLNMSAADITQMFKLAPRLQRLQTIEKVDEFIDLLSRHGCTQAQIAKIFRTQPGSVPMSQNILEPKIKLLEDFGIEGQALAKILTLNPRILTISLENDLLPKMKFLKNAYQSQNWLCKALVKEPQILNFNLEKTIKPSLAFWEGLGLPGTGLSTILRAKPTVLTRTCLTPAQINFIDKSGIDKGSKMFKHILSIVVASRIETLEAKFENFKLCGLSAEETWQLFRAVPCYFCYSKENVTEKMKFMVNIMQLPANHVVKHPSFLMNFDKIVRPRFLVLQKIKSTNGLDLPLLSALNMRESKFVSKIIKEHPESASLLTIYENAISNASNRTKNSTKRQIYRKKL